MNAWHNRVLRIFGVDVTIEDFIAEVIGLSMQGRKFYKEKTMSLSARMNFLWDKEKVKIKRLSCGGYDRTSIKPIWGDVAMALMHYYTLDGRYFTIYGHHFMLLNHFHHGNLVSFSFHLLLSLENGILEFRKNSNNPFLHEGLIFLIVEHIKLRYVIQTYIPSRACKSKDSDYDTSEDFIEVEEFEGDSNFCDKGDSPTWSNGYQTNLELEKLTSTVAKSKSSSKARKGGRVSKMEFFPSPSGVKCKIFGGAEEENKGGNASSGRKFLRLGSTSVRDAIFQGDEEPFLDVTEGVKASGETKKAPGVGKVKGSNNFVDLDASQDYLDLHEQR